VVAHRLSGNQLSKYNRKLFWCH